VPHRKPLWNEILKFSNEKYRIATILIVIGLVGLVFPIIPGLLLIGLGILLIKPEWFERVKSKLKF
jgi:uncharacterized protein YqgC (DUF456 family)